MIPNGVDSELFATAQPRLLVEFGIKPGSEVITHVGRLDAQKSVDWLLEQMGRILASRPKVGLLLVGEGPEQERLEQLTARLGLCDRVHFAGFCQDIANILAASDLCVLASRWEGMPNALLEAMAAGKPVVATRVEGVEQALGDSAGPQTALATDPQTFTKQVVAILSDPQLAARLGSENQLRAREHFSLASMAEAYQRLYASLLASE